MWPAGALPDDVGIPSPASYTGDMSEKKPRVTDNRERVSCLRCGRMFLSPDSLHPAITGAGGAGAKVAGRASIGPSTVNTASAASSRQAKTRLDTPEGGSRKTARSFNPIACLSSNGIPNWHSFEPFINAFVEPTAPYLLAAHKLWTQEEAGYVRPYWPSRALFGSCQRQPGLVTMRPSRQVHAR